MGLSVGQFVLHQESEAILEVEGAGLGLRLLAFERPHHPAQAQGGELRFQRFDQHEVGSA
jgi:hypothetical protein